MLFWENVSHDTCMQDTSHNQQIKGIECLQITFDVVIPYLRSTEQRNFDQKHYFQVSREIFLIKNSPSRLKPV